MLAAYVDFKKVFDSVHWENLWSLLSPHEITQGIVALLSRVYSETESAVECGGGISTFFSVTSGVRRDVFLPPSCSMLERIGYLTGLWSAVPVGNQVAISG